VVGWSWLGELDEWSVKVCTHNTVSSQQANGRTLTAILFLVVSSLSEVLSAMRWRLRFGVVVVRPKALMEKKIGHFFFSLWLDIRPTAGQSVQRWSPSGRYGVQVMQELGTVTACECIPYIDRCEDPRGE